MITQVQIVEAVARGWCHSENAGKAMDVDLATAICVEVYRAMLAAAPAPPVVDVTWDVCSRVYDYAAEGQDTLVARNWLHAWQRELGPTLGMISREEHAAAVELAYMDGHSDCDHERSVWHVSTDWRDSEARKRLEAP
jgi:hypothetical protein